MNIPSIQLPARTRWLTAINLVRLAQAGLAAFLALSGFKLLAFSYNIIRTPFQLELREGAILSTTYLLLEGRNPFSAENLPAYTNGYGIVYNLVAAPFARLFGDTLITHRAVTGLFIFLAVAYLAFVMIRKNIPPLYAAAGGLCVLANQLYSVTPMTRPDGLGFFLYVVGALLPWEQNFSRRSLIASLLLGILAFYTKLYFFLAVVYVAVFLFLFVSKRAAVLYGAAAAVLLLLVAVVVFQLFPYYFYVTFFMATYQPVYVMGHMLWQFRQLAILYAGMIALALLMIIFQGKAAVDLIRGVHFDDLARRVHLGGWKKPLLSVSVDYPLLALVIVSALTVWKLGGHTGSKMAYLFQLISPLLVLVMLRLFRKPAAWQQVAGCALLCLAVVMNLRQLGIRPVNLQFMPRGLINAPEQFEPNWSRMARILDQHQRVLNAPLIAGYMVEHHMPVIDNGHTEYFTAHHIPVNPFLPNVDEIQRVDTTFKLNIRAQVKQRAYDAVIIDKKFSPFVSRNLLKKYYHFDQAVNLYAYQNREFFTLEVWLPDK